MNLKNKIIIASLISVSFLSGCSVNDVRGTGFHDYSQVNHQRDNIGFNNTTVKYQAIPINSRYGVAVKQGNNFYLGVGKGLAQVSSVDLVKKELFKKERIQTLTRLCKSQFPEINEKTKIKIVEKKVETCSLDYTKDIPLRSVFFNTGSSEILPSFYPLLDSVYVLLGSNPTSTLKVTGYTDSSGGLKLNNKLAKERAEAIKSYLVEKGIDSSRISVDWKSKSNYLLPNENVLNRAVNKRSEMIFNFNLKKD